MSWFNLIPAIASGISGLSGGGRNTSTTTQSLTPQMQQAVDMLLKKSNDLWSMKYPKYTGQRVAGDSWAMPMIRQSAQTLQSRVQPNQQSPFMANIRSIMDAEAQRGRAPVADRRSAIESRFANAAYTQQNPNLR